MTTPAESTAGFLRRIDWVLLGSVLLICVIGVVFIWSASYRFSPDAGDWTASRQPVRQVVWLALSLGLLVAFLMPKYTICMRAAYPLYVIGLLLLIGLFFMPRINEVHRWYRIGTFLFQPSEFMKVLLILTLARYLMYRKNYRTLKGLIAPFVLTLIPVMLIVRQPDLGTALVFLPILFALLYVAGAKRMHLIAIILMGLLSMPVLYSMLRDYQKNRLVCFINPEKPEHRNAGGFQLLNSVCAVGSGGLFGNGWGAGTQNLYGFIPADDTDFIFAVLGEEWGFVGASFLLALYFLVFLCGLGIARNTREPFGRLVAVGVITMLATQVLINVGMTVQLMPVTGLPLPFMSYGGSSLLSSFLALALLVNVGMNNIPVLADEDFK
jgi:rod shape determining protein RodA